MEIELCDQTIEINQVKLILIDDTAKQCIYVDKTILSAKSEYFKVLFNKFKESNMKEITINVPNVKATINIIYELMKPIVDNKSLVMSHDYLSLNYDGLIDKISDANELVIIGNRLGYSDLLVKNISKKLPKGQILDHIPENIKDQIKKYQFEPLIISVSGYNKDEVKIWNMDTGSLV